MLQILETLKNPKALALLLALFAILSLAGYLIYKQVKQIKDVEGYADLSKDFKEEHSKDYTIKSIACSENAINEAINNYTFSSVPSIR